MQTDLVHPRLVEAVAAESSIELVVLCRDQAVHGAGVAGDHVLPAMQPAEVRVPRQATQQRWECNVWCGCCS